MRPRMLALLVLMVSAHCSDHRPFAEPPPSTRLALWSTATGALAFHASDAVWHMAFGERLASLNGSVLFPPESLLCGQPSAEWRDLIILAGDWMSPGCSVEARLRSLQSVGAAAGVFVGTEGLASFDWDGSDRSQLHSITGIVLGPSIYAPLAAEVDSGGVGGGSTESSRSSVDPPGGLHVWLMPTDTPLSQSASFSVVERGIQIIFFVAVLLNVILAVRRLNSFWRARKLSNHMSNNMAPAALALELAASVALAVFLVDGPVFEHTRPAIFPWIVDRLSISVFYELHMLSTLVVTWRLRQIQRAVENKLCIQPGGSPMHPFPAQNEAPASACAPLSAIQSKLRSSRAELRRSASIAPLEYSTHGHLMKGPASLGSPRTPNHLPVSPSPLGRQEQTVDGIRNTSRMPRRKLSLRFPIRRTSLPITPHGRRSSAIEFIVPSFVLNRYDRIFVVMILAMVVIDCFAAVSTESTLPHSKATS